MKYSKLITTWAIVVALLASCGYNQFEPPCSCEGNKTKMEEQTFTIGELKALYRNGGYQIAEPAIITGQVISDDGAGNFYKSIIIEDETGGIEFKCGLVNSNLMYKRGSYISVNCHGLVLGKYGDLVTLGASSSEDKYENAYLPDKLAYQVITSNNNVQAIKPKKVTLSDINLSMSNTLIQIDNVQFIESDLDKTFADYKNKEKTSAVNLTITDDKGNTITLRTSSYSQFAAKEIPNGSGSIIAILSFFYGKPQLVVSFDSDIQFNNPRLIIVE